MYKNNKIFIVKSENNSISTNLKLYGQTIAQREERDDLEIFLWFCGC